MPKWLYKSLTDGKIVKTQEEYDAAIAAGYMCIDDLPKEMFEHAPAPAAEEEEDPFDDHEGEEPAATETEVQDATAVMEAEGAPAAEEATEENTAPETAEQRRDRKAAEMLARNAKK